MPKKTPGPSAGQARPRKTFLVHPWPPARHQASPQMPPAPKALEMSDKLIDAQVQAWSLTSLHEKLIKIKRIATEPQQADHGPSGPGKPGNVGSLLWAAKFTGRTVDDTDWLIFGYRPRGTRSALRYRGRSPQCRA